LIVLQTRLQYPICNYRRFLKSALIRPNQRRTKGPVLWFFALSVVMTALASALVARMEK
jgi:hypothetical protein